MNALLSVSIQRSMFLMRIARPGDTLKLVVTNILILKIMENKQKHFSILGKYCTSPILVNIVLSMGLGRSEVIGANRIMIRMPFGHISLIGVWAQSF